MDAAAAAPAQEPVDVDVWGTEGALASIEGAVGQLEEHRNQVSRAAAGNAGSQAGAQLSAAAAHLTVAIRAIEDGLHRLRAVRDGTAGAAPREGMAGTSRIAPAAVAIEGGAAVPLTSPTIADDAAFAVPVSADGDPFNRQFLNVRPSALVGDLTRAAIERLGFEQLTGTWALHLEGRPLTDQLTAADAGLRRGSELVLLRV